MDDLGDYRPGLQAVAELGVKSPLREAGPTKAEIRELSKEMGLSTWEKPSFACLASRFVHRLRGRADEAGKTDCEGTENGTSGGRNEMCIRDRSYLVKIVRNISLKIYWRKESAKRSSHYTIALEEIEACIAAPNTVEACLLYTSPYEIARILALEKVERPSYYLAQRGVGKHQSNFNPAERYTWLSLIHISPCTQHICRCWATARICSVILPMWTSTLQILPRTTRSTRNT